MGRQPDLRPVDAAGRRGLARLPTLQSPPETGAPVARWQTQNDTGYRGDASHGRRRAASHTGATNGNAANRSDAGSEPIRRRSLRSIRRSAAIALAPIALAAGAESDEGVSSAALLGIPPATSREEGGWDAEIEAGGTHTTGNTRSETVSLAARLRFQRDDWFHRLRGRFDLTRTDFRTDGRKLVLDGKSIYALGERTYSFALGEFIDDKFSGFDYEIASSVGLGYRLIDADPVTFDLESGPGIRFSRREDSVGRERELTWRFGQVFAWQISETAELTNESAITFGQERSVTESTTALTTEITETIGVRVSYMVRRNSRPPPGRVKVDTVLRAALVFNPF